MKSNMKNNIKKIATLTLAVLSLAALLSLMPEHSRAYHTAQAKSHQTVAALQN